MNLFDKHSSENEKQAKAALVEVAAHNIGRYIIAQEFLNSSLAGGTGSPRSKKNGSCLLCKVDRVTKLLAKLEGQLGQILKTHELLFDSNIDVHSIVSAASKEFYPLVKAKSGTIDSETDSMLEKVSELPTEIKDIASLIKSVIRGMTNGDVDVSVVEVTGKGTTVFGVNPNDHKDFKSFFKAVTEARKSQVKEKLESILSSDTPGEEIIKEAIIHNVEETAETVGASPATPSSNGEEKKSPKSTKSSGSKPN